VTSWTGVNPANLYQVVAYNAAGDSVPGTSATTTTAGALVGVGVVVAPVSYAATPAAAPVGPTGLSVTLNADGSATLVWNAVAGATGYLVTINGGAPIAVNGGATTSYIVPKGSLIVGNNTLNVAAQMLNGNTDIATVVLNNAAAVAPVAFVASVNAAAPGTITLNWANSPLNLNNVTGLTLSWTHLGVPVTKTFAPNVTGASIINLKSGAAYFFKLQAISNLRNSAPVATVPAGTVAP
jgi:hypothetical protein